MSESVMPVAETGKPEFSPIPQELRDSPRWVLRKAKVPYQPDGSKASVSNDKTWSTFTEALSTLKGGTTFDGLGFNFTKNDQLCGIDLDGCRDPETGEVATWAQEIIDKVASYAR